MPDFPQHGGLTARLNGSTLMCRDGAESASSETAPHDRDRVLDHLEGGDRFRISGVRPARERQVVDRVHGLLRNRDARRIGYNGLSTMPLHQTFRIPRIRLVVNHFRGFGEGQLVGLHVFEAGNLERIFRRSFRRSHCVCDAAHIPQVADTLAGINSLSNLDNRLFAHPEDDQIRLGIENDRAADFVAPVVVMGESP